MSTNLIQIKAFLGKYYPELLQTAQKSKYSETNLSALFEQRFCIQNNKTQMIVDPAMPGLSIVVNGNEILVSKQLFDHPNVVITNSIETNSMDSRSLYNPDVFSTVAYLLCQNSTMLSITGDLDEPLYIKYRADLECFYSSVLLVKLADNLNIEIVEEIESLGALNAVTNYILEPAAKLKLTTFYRNIISAQSFLYRSVIAQDFANYTHMQFGIGSSNIIDETHLHTYSNVKVELLGCIYPGNYNFHTILALQPIMDNCQIGVNHRLVLNGSGVATFTPVNESGAIAEMDVTSFDTTDVPNAVLSEKVNEFVSDVVDRAVLERIYGSTRFYLNKSKFLSFQ
jgi:hypothetical protein